MYSFLSKKICEKVGDKPGMKHHKETVGKIEISVYNVKGYVCPKGK